MISKEDWNNASKVLDIIYGMGYDVVFEFDEKFAVRVFKDFMNNNIVFEMVMEYNMLKGVEKKIQTICDYIINNPYNRFTVVNRVQLDNLYYLINKNE